MALEYRRRLKRTKQFGKKLDRLNQKLLVLDQAIYDLGMEFEGDFPESKHGGLIYQKVMRADEDFTRLRNDLHNIVTHCADLDADDCVEFDPDQFEEAGS